MGIETVEIRSIKKSFFNTLGFGIKDSEGYGN